MTELQTGEVKAARHFEQQWRRMHYFIFSRPCLNSSRFTVPSWFESNLRKAARTLPVRALTLS